MPNKFRRVTCAKIAVILLTLMIFACNQNQKPDAEPTVNVDKPENSRAFLDTIRTAEQEPIRLRDSIGRILGIESDEAQAFNEIYKKNHVINEEKIKKFIDSYGWPSKELVGEEGHIIICNVIQHSSPEVRVAYLPIMKKAVTEKGLSGWLLARAEDRIATDQGKLQIYGGQVKYYPETKTFNVWPIVDPENVDKRRAEIGLEPVAEFLKNRRFSVVWNPEEQIKRTKAFERGEHLP